LTDSGSDKAKSKDQQPGFSFTKSAIADLPSTAVQSIYIDNDQPVEVDDEVFVWRDVTPSGTKLPAKTKFKKQEVAKKTITATTNKQKAKAPGTAEGKAKAKEQPPKQPPKKATSAGKSTVAGPLASKEKVTSKSCVKTGSQSKVTSADSKSRVKERRPSQTSKVASGTKVADTRSKANSKTKVAPTSRDKQQPNQGRGK